MGRKLNRDLAMLDTDCQVWAKPATKLCLIAYKSLNSNRE